MRVVPILALMLLSACSRSSEVADELPNSSLAGAPREAMPETRIEATLARPVTIGEDGPRLDACGAMGQATRVGPQGLSVRSAPFAEAKALAQLAEGARVHVCTRSIDQKWLGVVIPPPVTESAAPTDCGVREPVDRKQAYAGPCVSGWVSSAYVRLVAG